MLLLKSSLKKKFSILGFSKRESRSLYRQLTSSLLVFLIIFQTIIGIFMPMNISFNPTKVSSDIEQANASGENWYETGGTWNYRKQIVIDHTKVSGDLTNFPVLVSFTDSKLKDTTNGGNVAQSNGNDILFTSSDGSTKLSHEIETYTNTTGQLIAWVKVPNLSSTTDTILYLYYGNNTATNQQDPTNVWDSNYVMVQHMKDATTSTITDSTAYANNGTKRAANESLEIDGKIGKAQSFDGVNDYIQVADSDSLDPVNQITISGWVYAADNLDAGIVQKGNYNAYIRTSSVWFHIEPKLIYPQSQDCFGLGWSYISYTYNGSQMKTYTNGSIIGAGNSLSFSGSIIPSSDNLSMGTMWGYSSRSRLDEVRISNIGRSSEWVATEYNNQSLPNNFMSIGSESGFASLSHLSSWKYRKAITIDHTKVQGETQTNLPVLINLSQDTDIISHAKTDGSDIVFSSSDINWESGSFINFLPYQIEKYDNNTGQLIAWVKVPNLSSTTDTVIYMYYGNSDFDSSMDEIMWSKENMVYHLSNSDANHSPDGTYRGNDATKKAIDEPLQSPGKINQSQGFDGIDDYLSISDSSASDISPEMTLEAWISPSFSAWTKKKPIVVTGEDELARMQIDYAEGMQADFDDLRFVDENGTLLRYKIESYTASASAIVILEFSSIPSSEAIYMYYGNPEVDGIDINVGDLPEINEWSKRQELSVVNFNNKLWMLGGLDENDNYKNDVWFSADGHYWTQETAAAAWPARGYFESIVFDGRIWVMGGYDSNWSKLNDVWSSSDGVNWTQETAAAAWPARVNFQSVVFNNKIWIMGGGGNSGRLNDVWSSSDGVNWTQETAAAAWPARSEFQSIIFNNKIWIMGGGGNSGRLNDVWSSSDGVNWTQETAAAAWPARVSFQSVAFNNKIWVMGGYDSSSWNILGDIWSSPDGINWTREISISSWGVRKSYESIVFNSKIWVVGGNSDGCSNDVWSSSDGINWNHDSAPTSSYTFSDAQDVSGALGTILGKGTNYNLTVNDSNIPLDEWTHIAITNDGTTQKYYINGNLTSSRSKAIGSTDSNLLKIGDGYYSFPFSGSIDEVRISNTAYSANQIKTQYNNQSSSSTFYALGKQQTYGVNDPTQVQYFPTSQSIEITWESNNNDNTTEYYIENVTNGTNSNWQTGLRYKFSELACKAEYTFRIKARKNGLETLPDTYLFDTAYCGGVSFVPTKPTPPPVTETPPTENNNDTPNNTENNDTNNQQPPSPETPSNPGNTNPTPQTPSPAPLPPITQTISKGTSGSTVQTLQDNLKTLGYFPSNIESNGNFGPTTLQAVKDFQKAHGINPTGFVGPITLKALNNENVVSNQNYQFNQDLKYNDRNEDVKQLQTNLKERAFFPSSTPSTGWFGPITQKAVNLFKKIYNLVNNGIVDEPMREILNG